MKKAKKLFRINLLVILCVMTILAVCATASAARTLDTNVATGGNIQIATSFDLIPGTQRHNAYIKGYKDGTIRPEALATRAEVATIFYRLLDDVTRTQKWTKENDFSDVPSTAWYSSAVSTVARLRVIKGYPDGTFSPNKPVSREEFVIMLVRFFGVELSESRTPFTDVDHNSRGAAYIAAAYEKGWIKGNSDAFRPDDAITRAEVVTMINRADGRTPHKDHLLPDMLTWSDNQPGDWHYAAIQEASNTHFFTRIAEKNADGVRYEHWIILWSNPDWKAIEKNMIAAHGG